MNDDLRTVLRAVPLFSHCGDTYFDCVIGYGSLVHLETDEILVREGDPSEHFFVLLEGEIRITKQLGASERILNTYLPGTFFGEMPILLGSPYIATGRATKPSTIFRLPQDAFYTMLTQCPKVTREILRVMASRVQSLQTVSQQHHRLMALGTLAAGLAHELNNPAAAAKRAASQLRDALKTRDAHASRLHRHGLAHDQHEHMVRLQDITLQALNCAPPMDMLAQSDRESEIECWLEAHQIRESWTLAPMLASYGMEIDCLDYLASQVPAEALEDALGWITSGLTARVLIDQVEGSHTRIFELVETVKDYSFMDQAPVQEIDVHDGLENTLTVLGHKITANGITVTRSFDPNLPCITAYGSEINQVWTHLIDNAIDALAAHPTQENPEIQIQTHSEGRHLLVEIIDNGPGIASEIQSRVFEPFFTTKPVGQGSGLGLEIAYRIVISQHKGDLKFDSQPGRTRFQVRLPIIT